MMLALRRNRLDRRRIAQAQGLFNIVGGLWPLLSIRSLEAVYGPKVDRWLECTVGGLLVTIGIAQASSRTPSDREVARRLGIGTAATLLAIDLVFVPQRRIRATYLQDAVCELAWLGAWATSRDDR